MQCCVVSVAHPVVGASQCGVDHGLGAHMRHPVRML
jgi:hypothetical protein